jgi:hypothetical protein
MGRRLSRAKREAIAPSDPAEAMLAYGKVMANYATRTETLVLRHVVGALPIAGSGDPLDVAALERGLFALEVELGVLAEKLRPNARAAGKRVSTHARRESERLLDLKIPKDITDDLMIGEFEDRNVRLLRKLGRRQVAEIRKAIAAHEEGDSMRADILHKLWVARNNGQLIARDQPRRFSREAVMRWSSAAGSEGGIYHTAKDERVRRTHQPHDGKYYRYGEFPSTLQEPGCRCKIIPRAPEG